MVVLNDEVYEVGRGWLSAWLWEHGFVGRLSDYFPLVDGRHVVGELASQDWRNELIKLMVKG